MLNWFMAGPSVQCDVTRHILCYALRFKVLNYRQTDYRLYYVHMYLKAPVNILCILVLSMPRVSWFCQRTCAYLIMSRVCRTLDPTELLVSGFFSFFFFSTYMYSGEKVTVTPLPSYVTCYFL